MKGRKRHLHDDVRPRRPGAFQWYATVAAGTYPIVITAAEIGADAQQAPLTVVITVPDTEVPSINFVVAGGHTCSLTVAGVAYCWGFNGGGQLGNNDTSLFNPTPVAVVGAARVGIWAGL